MKKLQNELFEIAEAFDAKKITAKQYREKLVITVATNATSLKPKHVNAIIDFILNEQIFES